jgi:hypothetical protein
MNLKMNRMNKEFIPAEGSNVYVLRDDIEVRCSSFGNAGYILHS